MAQANISSSDLASLPVDQRKQLASTILNSLSPSDQRDVAMTTALHDPTAPTNDRIWLIMIVGFVIVLVGSFIAVAIAILFKLGTSDSLLTVFTTVAGILAALLAPSPIKNSGSRS